MTQSALDVTGQIRFDLSDGAIRSAGNEPLAVIPLSILAAATPSDDLETAARAFGLSRGREMASRLSDAEMQALSDEIAAQLALMGLGRPAIEVVGDALLIRVATATAGALNPVVSSVLRGLLGGLLEGIAGSHAFQVVALSEAADETVFFAGNPRAASLLKRAVTGGIPMMEALTALGQSGGAM